MSNEIETRDELVREVVEAIELGYSDITAKPGSYDVIRYVANHSEVERVIDIVYRAAWQEFEAAMLSDEAVEAASTAGSYDDKMGVFHHCGYDALVEALTVIASKEDTDER